MEDQPRIPGTQPTEEQELQRYKTLGIRLDEDLHARLSFIAQLTGSTLSDEIRRAIEARVVAAQDDPELGARAEAVRAEIEREAQARQQAIAGFFGKAAVEGPASPRSGRRRRGSSEAPDRP
jgi:predicted transcriptional regulator